MRKYSSPTITLLFCLTFAAACGDTNEPGENTPDSGVLPDSGTRPDSGTLPDSGVIPDAGTMPDSGTEVPPELTYCDGYVRGCERQVECGVVVYNHAKTKEQCLLETACAQVDTATLAVGNLELDADKIEDCKTKIDALSCEQLAEFRGGTPAGLESCSVFTRGTIAEGEACSALGFEACAEGLRCDFGNGQCPGQCEAIPEPCTQDGCAAGEYCSYATRACVQKGNEGTLCEPNEVGDQTRRSCQAGLHCLAQLDQDSRCTVRIPLGDACDQSIDIELCAEGSYCDPTVAKPTCIALLDENMTCNFLGQCREDLFCDFSSTTCRPQGQLGDACNESAGSCALGLACDETCKKAGDIHAPIEPKTIAHSGEVCGLGIICESGSVCALDAENNPFCSPAFAPGAACEAVTDAFACARGLCNFSTNTCPEVLQVGDACAPDGLYTGCPFALCIGGKCAAVDELTCEEI